ncbi:hypothetical protein JOC94_004710 [Bacillus thermophilus]|uniref:Uncharacterized protein n=1 Tax=Siminovitchia thermophila TaxID=1245522 RepID=A0ABS2REQ1_9BACI|nr:hypothetical protein [Siminovitchia thermophila]MBM7717679.1 hypothetical protein [Siminovitchia thermophila]ONK24361.1 hypothetical protein BLX87_05460 [Bacillus sp. VT-16-64]
MEKLTMQGEFRKLNSLYGRTPDKQDTAEEIAARCAALTDQMDELLENRGHELKHLRNQGVSKALEGRANVPLIYRKKANGQHIDAWANLLDKNYEWLERKYKEDEIKRRSAKEWRELERAYVVRSSYTLWDFYDDYKTLIEEKEADWNDYRTERKKWRQCKHRFCLELFPIDKSHFQSTNEESQYYRDAKRKDARFCCVACRKGHFESVEQFARTAKLYDNPTYLPPEIINEELELDASKQERTESYEVSFSDDEQLEALKSGKMESFNFEAEAVGELEYRSADEERRARYEAFIRGEGEPVFTVKIKKDEEISEGEANKRSDHRFINEELSA